MVDPRPNRPQVIQCCDVYVDPNGVMYVTDGLPCRTAYRAVALAPDGSYLESWPFPSRGGIQVMADDTVYISDVNAGIVNIVKDGTLASNR